MKRISSRLMFLDWMDLGISATKGDILQIACAFLTPALMSQQLNLSKLANSALSLSQTIFKFIKIKNILRKKNFQIYTYYILNHMERIFLLLTENNLMSTESSIFLKICRNFSTSNFSRIREQ